ncbi:UDP-glycosyltransferase UGT5-like [Athalia rosae]|uniref:UDP-glycosyltransferase UGT5-like n=1 Tax=Athalia rosae TaxID=37344 RepID=UPI002033F04C|nr:UDP-glycosyltransferase UGT5-like [Athalia rosae]
MTSPAKLFCLTSCAVFLMSSCRSEAAVRNEKFKILGVFPHPGKSHYDVFAPLIEELARRGHDLTVLSHFPSKEKLPNYKDISLVGETGIYLNVVELSMLNHGPFHAIYELAMLKTMAVAGCASILEKPDVKKLINSDEKFDLVIVEAFNTDCPLGFVHKFKAPFIGISSSQIMPWTHHRLGNPSNPSYVPVILKQLAPDMSFWERVTNAVHLVAVRLAYDLFFMRETQVLVEEAFGPGVPPLDDIAKNMSALLINSHFSLHGSVPTSKQIVEVGGLHIRGSKPLPKHIKDFLDSAEKEGVLLFSWGSMIKTSSMTKELLDMIVKVLANLKQKVIWKWESDLPNLPKNVMIQSWLPQYDILSHPNVKGFLTHGGLLGVSEGIDRGVPMLVVPMYGDQGLNAAAAAARGAAIILQLEDLTEKTLSDGLNEILNNPRYRRDAKAVSEAYRDRPSSALETAVWWTEYVARGKGVPFLPSVATHLSFVQYYLLDVIAFLLLATSGVIFIIFFAIKALRGRKVGGSATTAGKSNGVKKSEIDKKRA